MNLAAIPTFANDDIFHVIVEAPRGSPLKLKVRTALGSDVRGRCHE